MSEPQPFEFYDEYQTLKMDLVVLNKEIAAQEKEVSSTKINDKCNACGQLIDNTHLIKIKEDLQLKIAKNKDKHFAAMDKAKVWSAEVESMQITSLRLIGLNN
jgi:hypothetical protein